MSSIQDRILAKKKRVEELRKARETFTLTKVNEEDPNGAERDDAATPEPGSPQMSGSRGPSSPFSALPDEPLSALPTDEPVTRVRSGTLSRLASGGGPLSRTRSSSVLSSQSGGDDRSIAPDGASVRQSTARVIALSTEVDSLKREVHAKQQALEAAQREAESARDQNAVLQSLIVEKDRQLDKLTEKSEASAAALATLQERLVALQASSGAAASGAVWEGDAAERIAQLEADIALERLAWQGQQESLEGELAEAQAANTMFTQQFEALRELFYSTFGDEGGAAGTNHLDLFKNLRDERAVIEDELKELQAMHDLQVAEIQELRTAVQRMTSTQAYLEDTLAEYEEENKALEVQLATFHDQKKKDSGQLSEEIRTLQGRLYETESALSSISGSGASTQKEVETLRAQLAAANASVETLRNTKETLLSQIEDLQAQIESKEKETAKARVELERVFTTAEERERTMLATVEESRQQAETAKRELVTIKQVMDTQIESVKSEWREQSQDMMEAKVEAEAARKEYQAMQASMEDAMTSLKAELSGSKNDIEMAAIAGLNLAELVSTLRTDKATTEQRVVELDAALKVSEQEIKSVQEQLDARNELLTQVMAHLQAQSQEGEDEGEGEAPKAAKPFDPAGGLEQLQELKHRLEKAGRDYTSLQEALGEYEAETKVLNERMGELTKQHDEVIADRNRLEGALRSQTEQLEATQERLEEREGMLTEVMTFLKTKGTGGEGDASGAHGDEDAGDGDGGQGKRAMGDLRAALNAQMAEAAAEREQLIARLGEKETELKHVLVSHADETKRMNDQIDALDEQVTRLKDAEERAVQFEHALEDANQAKYALGADLETATNRLNSVTSELAGVKGKLEASEGRVATLQTELEAAGTQCAALTKDLVATREQVGTLTGELAGVRSKLEVTEVRVVTLEAELDDSNKQRDALDADLRQTRDRVSALEGELTGVKGQLDSALSELADIKEALAATNENMEAAAMAGLTLTEMIAKLKEEHAATVARLEAEHARLQREYDEYKERIAGILAMMAPSGSDDGDVLNQLKLRLTRAMDDQRHLEGMLTAADEENQKLSKTIDSLKEQQEKLLGERAELLAKVNALEADLRVAREELEHLRALCDRAASLVQRAPDDSAEGKPIDASLLNGLTRQGMDALLASLEAQMTRLRALEKELEDARALLQALRVEKAGLETRCSDLGAENRHLLQLKESLDRQIVSLLERITALELALAEARRTIEEQLETIRRLNTAIANLTALQKGTDFSALDKIRQLEEDLAKVRDEYLKLKQQLLTERELARERFLRKWEQNTRSCMECSLEFSVLNRRHHCRLCGKVLCRFCCSDRVHTSSSRRAVRVCKGCYDFMNVIAQEKSDSDRAKKRTKEIKLVKEEGEPSFGVDLTFKPLGEGQDGISAYVRLVRPGLPAERAGLREGDIVVCVNNIDLNVASQEDVIAQFKRNTVNLVVQENGPDAFEANTTTFTNKTAEVDEDELSDSSAGSASSPRMSPALIVVTPPPKDPKSPAGIPVSILSTAISRPRSMSRDSGSRSPAVIDPSNLSPKSARRIQTGGSGSGSNPFLPIEAAPANGENGGPPATPGTPTPENGAGDGKAASDPLKRSESRSSFMNNPFASLMQSSSSSSLNSAQGGKSKKKAVDPEEWTVVAESQPPDADADATSLAALTAAETASTKPLRKTSKAPPRKTSGLKPSELFD